MEHDVESHTEGKDVEPIPEEKIGECLEDIEEHAHINIVSCETRMLCHKGYQFP